MSRPIRSARTLRRAAHRLAPALAALSLVACGASDEGSNQSSDAGAGPSSSKLSRAELIAQADKICAATAAQIRSQPTPTSLAEVRQTLAEAAKATVDGVNELKGLTPPDAVMADYEAFLKRFEMAAQQTQDAAEASKSNDIRAVIEAAGNLNGDSESRRLARKIGFKVCRAGSGSPLPPGGALPDIPGGQPASP